jgi:cell wall-associated NlpC family hydrolase
LKRVWRIVFVFVLLFSVSTFAYASAFEEGDQGQDVAAIQSRLNSLGYDAGEADGDFGSRTTAAVMAFQRDRGLEADGVVGAATYRALLGREIPVSRDGSTATVRRIVQTALRYTGVPYSFGGTTPAGFDCSGYVRFVFGQSGVYLPRAADQQFDVGQWISYSRLQPGDLVFFTTYASGASHVGIYLGDGQFISATTSRGVVVDRMNSSYWGARYVGARRII